jgi:hypothetical protein
MLIRTPTLCYFGPRHECFALSFFCFPGPLPRAGRRRAETGERRSPYPLRHRAQRAAPAYRGFVPGIAGIRSVRTSLDIRPPRGDLAPRPGYPWMHHHVWMHHHAWIHASSCMDGIVDFSMVPSLYAKILVSFHGPTRLRTPTFSLRKPTPGG